MKNRTPSAPAPDAAAPGTASPPDENVAAFAALLDFAPVPRRPRVGGWSADVQRAFVAALAATGSPTRAAAAVGRAPFGVDQLFKARSSEGFRAACDAAMEVAHARNGRRLAAGVEIVVEDAAAWTPPPAPGRGRPRARPPEPHPQPAAAEAAEAADWLQTFIRKYLIKVEAERAARVAGRIVEADFYLRQLSWLEAMLDLASTDGFAALRDFRESGRSAIDIAETPMSRLLGDVRRRVWAKAGDPPRPEPTSRDLIEDHGRFSTEPAEVIWGGPPAHRDAQQRTYEDRHARDAALQIEWEARARRDHEARTAKDAI